MEVSTPLPQTYSPGSDIAAGFRPNQIVWGRTGNDTVLGYLPISFDREEPIIDVLLGDFEIPLLVDPGPRDWSNSFILGDWNRAYYATDNFFVTKLDNIGLNNFALIADFNSNLDSIQLYGTQSDYQLTSFTFGTAIWSPRTIFPDFTYLPDVIGVLPVFDLDLSADYFQFSGYTPPNGPTVRQVQQIGTSGFDFSNAVAVDASNNLYVAGVTTGSLRDLNSGLRDVWLSKYNSAGELLWTNQFGSSETDFVISIATDNTGDLYLTGLTEGNLGGERIGPISDAWIAKYDSDGNQQWVQKINGTKGRPTSGNSLDIDADGNIYLSGVTDSFNPEGAVLPISTDFWVAKYDSNGSQLWFQKLGLLEDGTEFDENYSNAVDRDGNVYSTGFTTGNLASPNAGLYDVWLTKHDTNGQLEWIRQFGTEDYEWAWGVDTDSQGNIYLGGYTLGNLEGTNAGSYDAWITKYDNQGNQLWTQQFGTPGDDEVFSLKIDSNDNIFLAGYTDDSLGAINSGSYDAWVAKYDSNGNQAWIQQFGTPQLEQAYDIIADNAGSLYVTGLSDGSLGGINAGSFDAWVAKLDATSGTLQDFSDTLLQPIPPIRVPPVTYPGKPLLTDEQIASFLDNYFLDFIIPGDISLNPYAPYTPYTPYTPSYIPEPSTGVGIPISSSTSNLPNLEPELQFQLGSSTVSSEMFYNQSNPLIGLA